jgi:hypothetical protein
MPRKAYNVSRQRSQDYRIAINGLLTLRARRMRAGRLGEVGQDALQDDLAAIDRTLRLAGFTGDIEAVTRDFRREAIFRRGELQRLILDALREAGEPMRNRQIAETIAAKRGHNSLTMADLTERVGKCLTQTDAARKGTDARWNVVWINKP